MTHPKHPNPHRLNQNLQNPLALIQQKVSRQTLVGVARAIHMARVGTLTKPFKILNAFRYTTCRSSGCFRRWNNRRAY